MGIQFNGNTDTISTNDGTLNVTPQTTFGGEVGVAGTLTYEDVTNVDSVGVITARDGLRVTGIATISGSVSIGDSIVHTGDTNTSLRFPAADTITAETGGLERLRIDSVGTLLVAHSNQRNNFNSASSTEHAPIIQLEGVNQKRAISITASGNNDGGILMLARQNGSVGANTVVSSGNQIGRIDFQASGGTNMELAAQIAAEVDGTPGDNDMPGRLLFKTTADGANSATERLRIDSSGNVSIHSGAYGGGGVAPQLYVVGTGGRQVKIHNTNAGTSSLQITNATTGQGEDAGTQLFTQGSTGDFWIQSAFATADLVFATKPSGGSTTERLRITSTGIIDAPTQAGFYARMHNNKDNVMGGGASYYTVVFDTDSGSICYDQHNTYSTSTGLYTVPTGGDGHYIFSTAVCLSTDAYGRAGEAWFLVGSNRYFFDRRYFTNVSGTITGYYGTINLKLTAGQTVGVQGFVSGGSTDVDVLGASSANHITWFTGRKIA